MSSSGTVYVNRLCIVLTTHCCTLTSSSGLEMKSSCNGNGYHITCAIQHCNINNIIHCYMTTDTQSLGEYSCLEATGMV